MNKESLQKPAILLFLWALYHLVIWTLVPLLCNTCLPLDSTEAVMWGSQWAWGYGKHPPLSAWAAELFFRMAGDGGVYALSQLCIITAGLGIYRLGRLLNLSARQAVMAVLLLDTIYYYQYISVEFNVNYLQMPFWAWGWYFGIHALEKRKIASWIGLGICVALGALTKYLAVFMLVPLFAAWAERRELKTALLSPGLWLAGVTAIAIFLPHLIWMKNHNWITIAYGLSRGSSGEAHWWNHLWNPLEFVLGQLAVLAPIIAIPILGKRHTKTPVEAPRGAMALGIGALAFVALLSLVTGMEITMMWAAPMPLAIGLWLVPRCRIDQHPKAVIIGIATMSLFFTTAYSIVFGFGPLYRNKPHRVAYPGHALAEQVEASWREKQNGPLQYVIADEFLGGLVNCYGNDRPAVMIRGSLERSPYLTESQIRESGALVLWLKNRDSRSPDTIPMDAVFPDIGTRYPDIQPQPDLIIPWPRRTDGKAGRYGIAYIPPRL